MWEDRGSGMGRRETELRKGRGVAWGGGRQLRKDRGSGMGRRETELVGRVTQEERGRAKEG